MSLLRVGCWTLLAAAVAQAAPAAKPAPKPPKLHPDSGPVSGLLTEKPQRPLDIYADNLTVMGRENRMVWKGHVHAVRAGAPGEPDLHLTCDELHTTYHHADGGEGQQVDVVTCEGHVNVVQGDRAGWGDKAVYTAARSLMVVTGHPRGQQGPNQFAGEVLTFHTDSDQVEVSRATATVETEGAGVPGLARPDGGKP